MPGAVLLLYASSAVFSVVCGDLPAREATDASQGQVLPELYNSSGSYYPPPKNLTLLDIRSGDGPAVNITWVPYQTAEEDILGYHVEVCSEECLVDYTTGTYLVWEGLDYWTTYTFKVFVFYQDGVNTVRSSPLTRRHQTGPGAPGVPTSLVASSYKPDAVVVSWGNPEPSAPRKPDGFNLAVCEVPKIDHCTQKFLKYSEEGYQVLVDDLEDDKDYLVQVSAFIEDAGETYTGSTANTTVRTLPSQFQAPSDVTYRLVASGEDVEVILNWNVPSGTNPPPDRFVVNVCGLNKCRSYSATTRSLVVEGLKFWSRYNATVWALYPTSRRATIWINGTAISMYTGPGAPHAPTSISALSLGPYAASLWWHVRLDSMEPAPEEFRVSVCNRERRCWNITKPFEGPKIHEVTLQRLSANTRYDVAVSTILHYKNESFESPAATTDFRTQKILNATPVRLSASLSSNQHDVDVTIRWRVPERVTTHPFKYRMEVRSKPNITEVYEFDKPKLLSFTLHFTLRERPFWTNYTVDLMTLHDSDEGVVISPASTLSVFTGPGAPQVSNLTLTVLSSGELMARWDAPAEHVDGFQLTICSIEITSCGNISLSRDVREYRVVHLIPWTRYTVGVLGFVSYGGKTYRGVPVQLAATTDPAEPTVVRDIKVSLLNISDISVSWKEPQEKRGPLSGYVLSCNSTDARHPFVVERVVPSHSTHLTVDLVVQVTTFECSLWAFNALHGIRVNGTAARYNVTTKGIPAPRKLAVISKTTTSLSLEWELNPKALNFSVSLMTLSKSNASSFIEEYDCDGNTTVCSNVTGLEPGAQYQVFVKNCGGYCGNAAVITAETQVAAPSEVRNLSVTEELNKATFHWRTPQQPNGPVDGYIFRLANLERVDSQVHDVPGNTTALTVKLGEQYNNYSVSVQAYNILLPVRKAGPAVVRNFESTGEGPIPPRPEVNDVQAHRVVLSWTQPTDREHAIVQYLVARSDSDEKFFTSNTSASIDNVETWTEYTVNISSCTAHHTCGPPKISQFRTDADAPSVPQDLNYTFVGKVWVALNWSNPETLNGPLSGFNVSWTNSSFASSAITTSNKFNITHLDQGCSYTISVFAFNKGLKALKAGPSANVTVKTEGEPIPPGCTLCPTTIVLMVVIPAVCIVLIAAYVLYRRALRNREERALLASEDTS